MGPPSTESDVTLGQCAPRQGDVFPKWQQPPSRRARRLPTHHLVRRPRGRSHHSGGVSMRKILKLSLAGLAAAALALACGNDNKSTGTTDAGTPDAGRQVTLNGAVTILPQGAPSLGATTVDMTKFSILLIEPITLLLNPGNIALATLGAGAVTATAGATPPAGTYAIPIDANRVTLAVVANVIDKDRKSTRLNSSHGSISYAVF